MRGDEDDNDDEEADREYNREDYHLLAPTYRPGQDELRNAAGIVAARRRRRRALILAFLVLTMALAAVVGGLFWMRHRGGGGGDAVGGEEELAVGEGEVTLQLENEAGTLVVVQLGEKVLSLRPGETRRAVVAKGIHDVRWSCEYAGETCYDVSPAERVGQPATWVFRIDADRRDVALLRDVGG
jgi:hypothetical protein